MTQSDKQDERRAHYLLHILGWSGSSLLSWGLVTLLAFLVIVDPIQFDLMAKAILGAVAGTVVAGFALHLSQRRVSPSPLALGAALGSVSGLLAGLVQIPIGRALAGSYPHLARMIAWMILGSLLATGIAAPRLSRKPTRIPVPFALGLASGLAAGLLMSFVAGSLPDIAQAVAYLIVGQQSPPDIR